MKTQVSLWSTLTLAALVGCSAPQPAEPKDDVPADGKHDTLIPGNTASGSIRLTWTADATDVETRVYLDGKSVDARDKLTVPAGDHRLAFEFWPDIPRERLDRVVHVNANETLTIPLAVVGLHHRDEWKAQLHDEFGLLGGHAVTALYSNETMIATLLHDETTGTARLAWPGTISFGFMHRVDSAEPYPQASLFWSQSFDLAAGESRELVLDAAAAPPLPFATIHVSATKSSLEGWFGAWQDYDNEQRVVYGGPDPATLAPMATEARKLLLSTSVIDAYPVPYGEEITLDAVVDPAMSSRYTYWLNGTYYSFALAPGDVAELPARKLDVENIPVTQPDGSVLSVVGSFSVRWQMPDGSYVDLDKLQKIPTQRGVVLVPGHYQVDVEWVDGDGVEQAATYEIDL